MNKQDLINKLKKLLTTPSEISGYDFDYGHDFGIERAILLAEDLDDPVRPPDPEKPVVPQFVADWYEEHKDNFEYSVQCLCVHNSEPVRQINTWFDSDDTKPIVTLVKMKLFGYEVEEEKLYEVFLKRTGSQLGVCVPHGEDKTQFTKVELQEYDFDNLDVYEVEEVE